MAFALTVGMWIHVYLNAHVSYAPTENPIWGELRLIPVIVSTIVLWSILGLVASWPQV